METNLPSLKATDIANKSAKDILTHSFRDQMKDILGKKEQMSFVLVPQLPELPEGIKWESYKKMKPPITAFVRRTGDVWSIQLLNEHEKDEDFGIEFLLQHNTPFLSPTSTDPSEEYPTYNTTDPSSKKMLLLRFGNDLVKLLSEYKPPQEVAA